MAIVPSQSFFYFWDFFEIDFLDFFIKIMLYTGRRTRSLLCLIDVLFDIFASLKPPFIWGIELYTSL